MPEYVGVPCDKDRDILTAVAYGLLSENEMEALKGWPVCHLNFCV